MENEEVNEAVPEVYKQYKNEVCPHCHKKRKLEGGLLKCKHCNNADVPVPFDSFE